MNGLPNIKQQDSGLRLCPIAVQESMVVMVLIIFRFRFRLRFFRGVVSFK